MATDPSPVGCLTVGRGAALLLGPETAVALAEPPLRA